MPASLPGATAAENAGNPTQGRAVLMDALSGPKGGPLDARVIASWDYTNGEPVYAADAANLTTGALCTGIGFGQALIIGLTAPASIDDAGFTDDYFPGRSAPDSSDPTDSTFSYIGGGKSTANVDGIAPTVPYLGTQVALCGAGNGGSRDAGAGTGFCVKTVTATGTVANGAAVETGFLNRSGVSIASGQSVFGSAVNANIPVT